jgi:DNA-nicking Smr family endonuclease
MGRRGGRRFLQDDERGLWSTVTKSIKPLSGRRSVTADVISAADAEDARSPAPKRPTTKAAPKPPLPAPATAPPLTPLDRRTRQRVARGKLDIDARLDLHGMIQSEAHAELSRFLHRAGRRGARLVLVITGKGTRGEGVLRRQVPQWLNLPEFRALVIGFETAHIGHGGEGALYVRLRRVRDTDQGARS